MCAVNDFENGRAQSLCNLLALIRDHSLETKDGNSGGLLAWFKLFLRIPSEVVYMTSPLLACITTFTRLSPLIYLPSKPVSSADALPLTKQCHQKPLLAIPFQYENLSVLQRRIRRTAEPNELPRIASERRTSSFKVFAISDSTMHPALHIRKLASLGF